MVFGGMKAPIGETPSPPFSLWALRDINPFFPSFVPSVDLCSTSPDSYFYNAAPSSPPPTTHPRPPPPIALDPLLHSPPRPLALAPPFPPFPLLSSSIRLSILPAPPLRFIPYRPFASSPTAPFLPPSRHPPALTPPTQALCCTPTPPLPPPIRAHHASQAA